MGVFLCLKIAAGARFILYVTQAHLKWRATVISSFENDELSEAYWHFSKLQVYKGDKKKPYDMHEKLYKSTDFKIFGSSEFPVVYFHKIGGSGSSAGVYRYQPAIKKLDFFEGGKGNTFHGFNEINKYEDVDGDGFPELFATSRKYHDKGFDYYWTVYKWPLEDDQPYIGQGKGFEKYLKEIP